MSERPHPTGEIVVVGLGPGDPGLLTRDAATWLESGRPVYLRTRVHPTVEALPGAAAWSSFDPLYERAASFEALYEAIVAALLAAATADGGAICYAVPGHPLVGESTVARLRAAAPARGVATRIVPGLSFVDVLAPALPLDPLSDNLQLVDGLALAAALDAEPFGGGRCPVSPLRPALIGQVYNAQIAAAVKLALMRLYPDDHPVTILRWVPDGPDVGGYGAGGVEGSSTVPLHALDRRATDHLTSVYLPALAPERAIRVAQGLQAIVARLRAPEGCPWDREQTPQSIRASFLEETYEALDALDAGDMTAFGEELGDVLLQVYLQSQMAEEAGEFVLEDVYEAIAAKLVRRHPHVFGDTIAADSGAVLRNWDQIKEAERRAKGKDKDPAGAPSALDGVPRSLPALARAGLIQERIYRLAPDGGRRPAAAFAQALERALADLREGPGGPPSGAEATLDRFGVALFALAGLARARGVDPEAALGAATAALVARFKAIEGRLRAAGRDWQNLTPAESAQIWADTTLTRG